MANQSYQKSPTRQESFMPIYVRVKERILDKRDALINSFDDYYKVCVIKNKKSPPKFDRWVLALISMYIEVRDKISDKIPEEKEFKGSMEKIIKDKNLINYDIIYNLQKFIINWLEVSGLTKIGFEKRDIIQQLEDEESDF